MYIKTIILKIIVVLDSLQLLEL